MKIFIDSAILAEIEEAFSCGFMDGVTTNPSLMKQAVEDLKATDENQKGSQGTEVSEDTSSEGEDIDLASYIEKVLAAARGKPVSLEVTALTAEGMIEQGRFIYNRFKEAGNVNIKIPVNSVHEGSDVGPFEGLKAIKALADDGIPVNCTLLFTPEQALLAAKAGAKFVSPFAGRMDDYIRKTHGVEFGKKDYYPAEGKEVDDTLLDDNGVVSGIDLCAQIVDLFDIHDLDECEVLSASLRNARQAREAALSGCDIATLPLYVIKDLVDHYKTREGMVGFINDIVPEYEEILK